MENDHKLTFPLRRLASNGLEAWEQVLERGYEGLVAKDESSVSAALGSLYANCDSALPRHRAQEPLHQRVGREVGLVRLSRHPGRAA